MDKRSRRSWIQITLIIFVLLILDQATKLWARTSLSGGQTYSFLGGLLQIQLAENSGAFLSLGSQWSDQTRFLVLSVGVGLFLAGVLWQLRHNKHWTELFGLVALLAGGIGNLIDRVYKGSVTDFLYMEAGPLHTGVFNVADMVIVASVIFLVWPKKK